MGLLCPCLSDSVQTGMIFPVSSSGALANERSGGAEMERGEPASGASEQV